MSERSDVFSPRFPEDGGCVEQARVQTSCTSVLALKRLSVEIQGQLTLHNKFQDSQGHTVRPRLNGPKQRIHGSSGRSTFCSFRGPGLVPSSQPTVTPVPGNAMSSTDIQEPIHIPRRAHTHTHISKQIHIFKRKIECTAKHVQYRIYT